MEKYIFLLGLFIVKYGIAQQNFINVPSIEVTKKEKLFFQQQINFNELLQSNTTLDYGLGSNLEVGCNVLGLNFSEKRNSFLNNDTNDVDPYNPLVMVNGLKRLIINERASFGIGTQLGLNFRRNRDTYGASLVYANLIYNDLLVKDSKLVGGVYYNSRHYGGKGMRFSGWLATEIPVAKKIHLMAESILGDNSLSYTSFGLVYYPKPYLPLTFGFQVPNIQRNSYAFVFELTIIP